MVFFFNDTAPTEIYTLSLRDALPISATLHIEEAAGGKIRGVLEQGAVRVAFTGSADPASRAVRFRERSEEHTSELQSRQYLVCRLLLETNRRTRHMGLEGHGVALQRT